MIRMTMDYNMEELENELSKRTNINGLILYNGIRQNDNRNTLGGEYSLR